MDLDALDPASLLWAAAAGFAAIAAWAAFADRRRGRRRDVDRPGWVPWSLVLVLAFLLAVVAASLAILA
jgi:hypothetical protein